MPRIGFSNDSTLAIARELCLLWYSLATTQGLPHDDAKAIALKRAQAVLLAGAGAEQLTVRVKAADALARELDGVWAEQLADPLAFLKHE